MTQRMDTIRHGQRFQDCLGAEWTRKGEYKTTGCYWAARDDGSAAVFAGCAEVTPLPPRPAPHQVAQKMLPNGGHTCHQ